MRDAAAQHTAHPAAALNARPKRASARACSRCVLADPLVAQAYADNCYASGITWTYGRADNSVVPHLLDRGHQVFLSILWEPWHRPPGTRDLREHPTCRPWTLGQAGSRRLLPHLAAL